MSFSDVLVHLFKGVPSDAFGVVVPKPKRWRTALYRGWPRATGSALKGVQLRSRGLTLTDLQTTQCWHHTFDVLCNVLDELSRRELDRRERHELIAIAREWVGPPLNLSYRERRRLGRR